MPQQLPLYLRPRYPPLPARRRVYVSDDRFRVLINAKRVPNHARLFHRYVSRQHPRIQVPKNQIRRCPVIPVQPPQPLPVLRVQQRLQVAGRVVPQIEDVQRKCLRHRLQLILLLRLSPAQIHRGKPCPFPDPPADTGFASTTLSRQPRRPPDFEQDTRKASRMSCPSAAFSASPRLSSA